MISATCPASLAQQIKTLSRISSKPWIFSSPFPISSSRLFLLLVGKLTQSEKHNLKSFTLPDPSLIQSALHRPISCQLLTRHLCPCVSAGSAKTRAEFLADLSSYRQGLADLIKSGRYEGRTNAAVVLQTGLEHLHLPRDKGLSLRLLGLPDVSLLPDLAFLAPDCTHPSQKLHARSKIVV